MAAQKVWVVGPEGVLKWYDDMHETPYYSLWSGNQIVFSYSSDDEARGRDLLSSNLYAFEDNKVSDVFTLKLHPDPSGKLITNNSPQTASLNFRAVDQYQPAVMAGQVVQFPNNPGMQRLMDKMEGLEQKLLMKEESEDALPPAVIAGGGMLDVVNRILEVPGVQQVLVPAIGAIVSKILPGVPAPDLSAMQTMPAASDSGAMVAGIPPDQQGESSLEPDQVDKLNQALDVLEEASPTLGDDLMKLAEMSKKDPGKFNMLLGMLRSM